MKEALYYKKLDDKKTKCLLCPHECTVLPDKHGICRARKNIDGILYVLNYEQSATSLSLDPIEKKPFFHFYPGTHIISLGPNSCNLQCQFCQNWQISQKDSPTIKITSDELVEASVENKSSIGIAYTYSEPFTWYEYILETAPRIKEKGLKNVLVTNGFVNEEPLKKLLPYIDAINIDIKGMSEDFYAKICKGKLSSVLKVCELAKKKCWVEITNLVIPALNDSNEEIEKLSDWIAENLGDETPLHFSRYFPQYKMNIPATSSSSLQNAYILAKNKLKYVYVGNINLGNYGNTYCPKCNNLLIQREGYKIDIIGIENKKCNLCQRPVDIIQEKNEG